MDLVAGHDLAEGGDAALAAAIRMAATEPGLSIGVVHVLSQIDLDRTGELDAAGKQRIAVEQAFPTVWRRIESVCEAEGVESDSLDIDVVVRVAAVHLVRSQATIAAHLIEVAREHGATRLVIGPRGRTGSVAEHVIAGTTPTDPPAADVPTGVIVVVVSARS